MSFDAGAVEATLTLDRTPFIASLRDAQRQVTGFARRTFEATLGADQTGFAAALANARREGAAFARENYEASIGARGATETAAEIKGVDTVADRLDGRDVTVDINADESGIRSLSEGFKNLAGNIRATGTVLAAASIPFGIAAIGAGIPTIAALGASLGGLAVALGSGLVGATVAATAALGGLAGAFGLVAAPVSLLLGNLKDYDDSLDAVKSAEGAARTAAQSRTVALKTLSDAQANVASTARDSKEAVEEQQAVLNRTRAEATAAINAQERVVAEARRTGTEAVAEEEQKLAQVRVDGARAIADQERTLGQTRISAADANAQAEETLASARDQLEDSTVSLVSAQRELNSALQQEPLNQAQATLDLASARDRASDAERAYAEAVAESGRGSEEATDAQRDLQQAQLDLQRTELEVAETRRRGSNELNSARDAANAATREQQGSAEAVREAEQGVVDTRVEGVRQIKEQQRALAQTRTDAGSQIAEQQRALAEARSERVQGEREALAELVRINREGNQQIREQEEALNDTRTDGAERVAEAQGAAVEAQRAAAQAAKDAAAAQKEVRQETVRLTPAQKALFDEYKRFQQIADTAFRGAQNASARLGVSILQLAESFLPRLGSVSEDTIGALTRSFETFRNELAQPVEQAGITRYLALIPDLTETAATAAGKLGLALFNIFSRSLRFALPLTTAIGDVADETLRWTESAKGARGIDRFFEDSVDMALRLLPAIEDLATGFGNLVSALQRTGIVDQSVRGFSSLAESFAESTRAGGGLDTFLRNARDLMPFVASAAKAVGGAILGIASAAIGAREKGSKLTTLQGIFKAIGDSARPLKNLVVGTFEALGPAIAQLLPELSRFFSTFAGASGPLVAFVGVITRALRIFNDLPPGVKRTVAQLAALKLILGGLGITAVVGPMGRFASNMFIAQTAASRLGGKSALPAVVGSVARLGVLLAGGLGLGLLAAGLFRAYQKNEDFRKSVNTLGDKAGEVFQGISNKVSNKVLPALGDLADKAANVLIDVFDLNDAQKQQARGKGSSTGRTVADATASAYQQALNRKVPESTNRALNNTKEGVKTGEGSPGYEIGAKIGQSVVNGLIALFTLDIGGKKGGKKESFGKRLFDAVIGDPVEGFADQLHSKENQARFQRAVEEFRADFLGAVRKGFSRVVFWNLVPNIFEFGKGLRGKFVAAGAAARQGFLEGFRGEGGRGGGLGGGIVGAVTDAHNALKQWQQEHSPAKRWIPRGTGAALGWLKGFDDTMKRGQGDVQHAIEGAQGQSERAIQAAQGTASGRRAIQVARSADSPGGKGITAAEYRAIMMEVTKAQAKNIYAAAVAAGLDPRVLRLLDSIMAKDFNFRTNMLADAR